MFDEMPSRRITERRKGLLSALYAGASLFGGYQDFKAHHRFEWSMLAWAFVFFLCVVSYWKKRHPDPWNPPVAGSEPLLAVNELKMEGKN